MKDEQNNQITKQLLSINKLLNNDIRHSRAQDDVLRLLDINSQMSQKQLQNELQVKSGSLSELLSKLEKRGYIIKERSKTDARSFDIKISELGKKKLTGIKKRGDTDIYEPLDEQEKQALLELLTKINKGL